jgi:hypothetical protein
MQGSPQKKGTRAQPRGAKETSRMWTQLAGAKVLYEVAGTGPRPACTAGALRGAMRDDLPIIKSYNEPSWHSTRMTRKLKTFQTSLGFYDLAIAAPSMKAALEAWGAGSNLFQESGDPEVIAATMSKPGIVLRRPVGSDAPFSEHPKRRRLALVLCRSCQRPATPPLSHEGKRRMRPGRRLDRHLGL